MLFWTIVKVALKSLASNKLRTFLAMLGIIIGVSSVIAMLAFGAGAQKQVMDRISAMGTNLLVVRPGQSGFRGVQSGTRRNLMPEDAEAIIKETPGVSQVAPVVSGNAQLKYFNKNTQAMVTGTSMTYFPIRNFEVERGRAFTESEAEKMARVAIIGPVTSENLFGTDENPLGQTIRIKSINFRVIGVLKSKGDQGWFNPDDQVIVPYTTAMKQLFGLAHLREIDVQVADGSDSGKVEESITALFRKRHHLQADEENDFNIRSQAEMVETASSFTRTFTILLGGIGSISLLVGGIGIMNIMLVTVTERTREIGVRKAIGAKDRDILWQFLLETVILSGTGGMIGVGFGVVVAKLVSEVTPFSPIVQLSSILLALSFSAAVGIFFGYYPARRAAMLNPIEALRYE